MFLISLISWANSGIGASDPCFHQPKVGIAERQNQTVSHPHLRCDSRCLNQERLRTLQATRSSVESCLICTASILPLKLMTATNIPLGKKKGLQNEHQSETIKNHQKPSTTDPIFPSPRYDSAFGFCNCPWTWPQRIPAWRPQLAPNPMGFPPGFPH